MPDLTVASKPRCLCATSDEDSLPAPRTIMRDVERAASVVVVENHDAAYYTWREAGVRNRILVHVDAHHDAWWVAAGESPSIADFLCPALRDNLVREVYWVVPDASWETRSSRQAILRHLYEIGQRHPGPAPKILIRPDRYSTWILGKPFHVCTLAALPQFVESVLLDLDVDYLLIPQVIYGQQDRHSPLPWCWPEELVNRLESAGVQSDLATIAYSVNGGYTPLRWKYLGDELALRLQQEPETSALVGMQHMRLASEAAYRGETTVAANEYRAAARLLSDSAAPHWSLAELFLQSGQLDAARGSCREALLRDATYRTPFNSAALSHFWQRDYPAAKRENERILQIDPENPHALLGMGCLTIRHKRWSDAEAWLRRAAVADPDLIDVPRLLAKALERLGRVDEAVAESQKSLRLSLAGQRSVDASITTATGSAVDFLDPFHGSSHFQLAELQARQGKLADAINGYRMAIAAGADAVITRRRLAVLYLRQRKFRQALQQGGPAMTQLLRSAGQALSYHGQRLWRAVAFRCLCVLQRFGFR